MSIIYKHNENNLNVEYFSENHSYLFKYPCSSYSTCSPYIITLKSGLYLLETWGSQGSKPTNPSCSGKGGFGGYSAGLYHPKKTTKLYLHIGATNSSGYGYNGGGNSNNENDGRGGGATDFRTKPGEWNQNFDSRIIVAGGGGGGFLNIAGGNGGGNEGSSSKISNGNRACYGTQNGCIGAVNGYRNGEIGIGATEGAGAGGCANSCSGGGGSGYIGGVISNPFFKKVTSFSSHTGFGEARITIIPTYCHCTCIGSKKSRLFFIFFIVTLSS